MPLSFLAAVAGRRGEAEFPRFHFLEKRRHRDMSKWTFVLRWNSRRVDLVAGSANIRDQKIICDFMRR